MTGLPQHIADDIQFHLDAIAQHFRAPKITLVVRPAVPAGLDADVVVTNDEFTPAVLAMFRRIDAEEKAKRIVSHG